MGIQRTTSVGTGSFAAALTLALSLIALGGCGSVRPVAAMPDALEPGGHIITRQEIADLGAKDAMEAVRRASTHLRIQHSRAGDPVRITQRGVSSFLINPEILVVIDGSRVSSSVRHLETIPAASIEFIQILTAREAMARWGSDAGNGVIHVVTSARL